MNANSCYRNILLISSFLIVCLYPLRGSAQELGPEHYDEDGNLIVKQSGFFTGIYVGSYWPNDMSATLYDGYGFDYDENKLTFEDSWMYEKIYRQYGGGYGQPDYISDALGVQPGEWFFDEADMPENMTYKTSWLVGFTGRYTLDKKNAVMLNINGAILKAVGNFTMTTRPPSGSTQINNSVRTYEIAGTEQRLHFQAGYQHLFGSAGRAFNFFMEGGLHATLAKFENNEIQIENLRINLYDSVDPYTGVSYYNVTRPVGLGFGAFGGAGFNIDTQSKWSLQLVYNMLLENLRISYDQGIQFSQSVGLRAYYTLFRN